MLHAIYPASAARGRRATVSYVVTEPLVRRALLSAAVAASPGTAFYDLMGYDSYAVSADGSTVVGSGPTRWTVGANGVQTLPPPPGKQGGAATAVNADGSVVVGSANANGQGSEAFEWTDDFGYEYLGRLGPDSTPIQGSGALGVSADGSVVVGTSELPSAPLQGRGEQRAFRWTPASGMQSLGVLPTGTYSRAYGVSADGTVIVGTSTINSGNGSEAFRWTAQGGMQGLGDLAGGIVASEGYAISRDGNTVVGMGYDGVQGRAVRWTQQTGMVSLGQLPGGTGWAQALAVNGDGSVIVGTASDPFDEFGRAGTDRAAFIWDAAHGMRRLQTVLETEYGLDLSRWDLGSAVGISADGRVITGKNVGGDYGITSWVAVLGTPLGQPKAQVQGRHIFYNDSAFDGGNPAANSADDAAIPPDKQVLLPGAAMSQQNVTNYSRGVNGVMVDVLNLPADRSVGADDFEIKFGNNGTPSTWADAPAPVVTVRRSPIPEAPARVTLTWPQGGVRNAWVRVTVKADADTGLSAPDTFYVGNLVGETADTSTPRVNAIDVVETRAALGREPVPITSRFDFDHNGAVNATDMKYVRGNQLARLYQFAAPASAASVPTLARAAPTRRGALDGITASVLREER
jgi:probable HAF family extracellular repeat protein